MATNTLEVGVNATGKVVISHPHGRIILSVEDALALAFALQQKAHSAEGSLVPEDSGHMTRRADGQQEGYIVLSPEDRSKGFVRPYRKAYRHLRCGTLTIMTRSISDTYARDPTFCSTTFCTACGKHFPIGEDGEFVWYELDGTTGPKVGT